VDCADRALQACGVECEANVNRVAGGTPGATWMSAKRRSYEAGHQAEKLSILVGVEPKSPDNADQRRYYQTRRRPRTHVYQDADMPAA